MKTHKLKYPTHGNVYENEGEFRTYCGITEITCTEQLFESDNFVIEHEACTCKVCTKAYDAECKKIEAQWEDLREFRNHTPPMKID